MKQRYKIDLIQNGEKRSEFFTAASPISALDQFHRSMQITSQIPASDYGVVGLYLVHSANAYSSTPIVHSSYDLPSSPTPVLVTWTKSLPVADKTEAMEFLATTTGGRLAE